MYGEGGKVVEPVNFSDKSPTAINNVSGQSETESVRYQEIGKIMSSEVLTISPESTLYAAAQYSRRL